MVPEVMSWYTMFFLWLPLIFFASSSHMVRTDISNGHRGFQKTRYLNGVDDVPNDDEDSSWTTTYNNTVTNATVQLGTHAYLHCYARTTGENSGSRVTWIRRRDWHILSYGAIAYTNDERFQVMHAKGSEDWTLQIKFVQKRDNGSYECQVSTSAGLVSHFVSLQIVVPKAFIQGLAERHVDVGTVISLVCIIDQSPTPPQYVFWYHNDRMINYDTARSGITVETLPGAPTHSRLTIQDTHDTDTGNYTCSASNTEPASIYVFVEEGDKMASLRKKSNATKRPSQMKYFTLLSMICSYILL